MSPLFSVRLRCVAATVVLLTTLSGCESVTQVTRAGLSRVFTPYRPDVVQGNVVTSEQMALLRPGRSRAEVRDILGSPLIADPFHADRWDYVFTLAPRGVPTVSRSVVVHFDGDRVKSVEVPEGLPSEREFVASLKRKPEADDAPEPKLELTPAERAALVRPARPVTAAASANAQPQGAARPYPPLESL